MQYPLLNLSEFDIEDATKFGLAQRFEHHDLVDPVHELRSELAASRFNSGLCYLLVLFRIKLRCMALQMVERLEAQLGSRKRGHFVRTQVAGHENHRVREINFPIVAERQYALIA